MSFRLAGCGMSFRLAGCGSSKRDRTQFSFMIKVRTRVFTQRGVFSKKVCVIRRLMEAVVSCLCRGPQGPGATYAGMRGT